MYKLTSTEDLPPVNRRSGVGGDQVHDGELLHAYSRAVISVVEVTAPAVVCISSIAPNKSRPGIGSGVILSGDGIVATNNHVVDGRERVTAEAADGDRIEGAVMGNDPSTDLAAV